MMALRKLGEPPEGGTTYGPLRSKRYVVPPSGGLEGGGGPPDLPPKPPSQPASRCVCLGSGFFIWLQSVSSLPW